MNYNKEQILELTREVDFLKKLIRSRTIITAELVEEVKSLKKERQHLRGANTRAKKREEAALKKLEDRDWRESELVGANRELSRLLQKAETARAEPMSLWLDAARNAIVWVCALATTESSARLEESILEDILCDVGTAFSENECTEHVGGCVQNSLRDIF